MMGWLPAQRLHQKFCLIYQTLSKPGEGRRAQGGTEGVPQTTPTPWLPSASTEAPGGSLPFDLCLSKRAFHHILVDLNHRKAAAKGDQGCQMQQWCHDLPVYTRPCFSWDLLRSTQAPSQAPSSPAGQISWQQLLRYSEFLTAILNISPRPLSQQRSALWGDTSPAAEALTREAEGTLASPTTQCCHFRGRSGALWRLLDPWNWSFTPINYFLSWQGKRRGESSVSRQGCKTPESPTCPWAPPWSSGDLVMWVVM